MTLYEIGILTHYACRVKDHEEARRAADLPRETFRRFVDELGLLTQMPEDLSEMKYKITERGLEFVNALQKVPLPRQAWVIDWPSGDPIEDGAAGMFPRFKLR